MAQEQSENQNQGRSKGKQRQLEKWYRSKQEVEKKNPSLSLTLPLLSQVSSLFRNQKAEDPGPQYLQGSVLQPGARTMRKTRERWCWWWRTTHVLVTFLIAATK